MWVISLFLGQKIIIIPSFKHKVKYDDSLNVGNIWSVAMHHGVKSESEVSNSSWCKIEIRTAYLETICNSDGSNNRNRG